MGSQRVGVTEKFILSLMEKHNKTYTHSFHSRGGGYEFKHFDKEAFAKEFVSLLNLSKK